MPREVIPQAEEFAGSPNMAGPPANNHPAPGPAPQLQHHMDSRQDTAYGLQDQYPENDQRVHHMDPAFDTRPYEQWGEANDEALHTDEQSGYNWGPPPDPHMQ
jgi:hypothetical protein